MANWVKQIIGYIQKKRQEAKSEMLYKNWVLSETPQWSYLLFKESEVDKRQSRVQIRIIRVVLLILALLCVINAINTHYYAFIVNITVMLVLLVSQPITKYKCKRLRIWENNYLYLLKKLGDILGARVSGFLVKIYAKLIFKKYVKKEIKPWAKFHQLMVRNFQDISYVDEYWSIKGMKQIENSAVVIAANKPAKEKINRPYVMKIYEILRYTTKTIDTVCNMWKQADISDLMHVKSIQKRINHQKLEVNLSSIREHCETIMGENEYIDYKKTDNEYIQHMISTKGTAGQYAKRTVFEEVIKTRSLRFAEQFWLIAARNVRDNIAVGTTIGQNERCYVLYRKKETIPIDMDGSPKITRLMQASHLPIRMADALTMAPYNDHVFRKHKQRISQVGINVIQEMAEIIRPFEEHWHFMAADVSQFDSSQHPAQMQACCAMRMVSAMRSKVQDWRDVCYIANRYEFHTYRIVSDYKSIRIYIAGQLATGDIVTSDDNSERAAAFVKMVLSRMANTTKHNDEVTNDTRGYVQGDDIIIRTTVYNVNKIEQLCFKIAREIGWQLREVEVTSMKNEFNARPMFLSTSVELQEIVIYDKGVGKIKKIVAPMLVRRGPRAYGKFFNYIDVMNKRKQINKEKIVSKCISFGSVLAAHLDIYLIAWLMIFYIGETEFGEAEIPYSWRNLEIEGFISMTHEHLSRLHFGRSDWNIISLKNRTACSMIPLKEVKDITKMNIDDVLQQHQIENQREKRDILASISEDSIHIEQIVKAFVKLMNVVNKFTKVGSRSSKKLEVEVNNRENKSIMITQNQELGYRYQVIEEQAGQYDYTSGLILITEHPNKDFSLRYNYWRYRDKQLLGYKIESYEDLTSIIEGDYACGCVVFEVPRSARDEVVDRIKNGLKGQKSKLSETMIKNYVDNVRFDDEQKKKLEKILGSLGQGNHFVNYCTNGRKDILVVHSGSQGAMSELKPRNNLELKTIEHIAKLNRNLIAANYLMQYYKIERMIKHEIHTKLWVEEEELTGRVKYIYTKGLIKKEKDEKKYVIMLNEYDGVCMRDCIENEYEPHGLGKDIELKSGFATGYVRKDIDWYWSIRNRNWDNKVWTIK